MKDFTYALNFRPLASFVFLVGIFLLEFLGGLVYQFHYLECFFKFLIHIEVQNGTEVTLYSTGQVRLYAALRMVYCRKCFVLAGLVLSENADKYISIAKISSHVNSCNAHESFDTRIAEVVRNGITDCFLHDAGYFFLPSSCHRNAL